MQTIQSIAKRIKQLCDKKGISVHKMLTESEAGARTYHNMLAGSYPSTDKTAKIASYLNCSVDYLLGMTENPNPDGKLTEDEKALLSAYRNNPDMQDAVKRLLNIDSSKLRQPAVSANILPFDNEPEENAEYFAAFQPNVPDFTDENDE